MTTRFMFLSDPANTFEIFILRLGAHNQAPRIIVPRAVAGVYGIRVWRSGEVRVREQN